MGIEKNKSLTLIKPFMPSLREFYPYLQQIWKSHHLTNNGPLHQEFERALCDFLSVKYISLMANGTLALMIALKVLNIKGEIITSPFTSIATLQAILWNNLKPVFVDIDKFDLNINTEKIEAAINVKTSAILPVHVFGNPCDVNKINEIGEKFGLKVVYDAAHCFGVKMNHHSICNYGDLSVLSFHATKVFNCFEGGAVICHDSGIKKKLDKLKNLDHNNPENMVISGLNAKLTEFQSAFGLIQLNHFANIVSARRNATHKYHDLLSKIDGISLIPKKENTDYNYTYLPIIVDPEEFGTNRDVISDYLKSLNISTRKYFYPLISNFKRYKQNSKVRFPVAEYVADNIICLPLFHNIKEEQIERVVNGIMNLKEMVGKKNKI